jgi:hypothetical protein
MLVLALLLLAHSAWATFVGCMYDPRSPTYAIRATSWETCLVRTPSLKLTAVHLHEQQLRVRLLEPGHSRSNSPLCLRPPRPAGRLHRHVSPLSPIRGVRFRLAGEEQVGSANTRRTRLPRRSSTRRARRPLTLRRVIRARWSPMSTSRITTRASPAAGIAGTPSYGPTPGTGGSAVASISRRSISRVRPSAPTSSTTCSGTQQGQRLLGMPADAFPRLPWAPGRTAPPG